MRKLQRKRHLILYALSGMGVNMLNLMVGSYLCSAVLVGGFGENAVAHQTFAQRDLVIAGVWSVFVLLAKIIDGVIDVPMASFTDRLRTRWGRRRPSLIIGFVPMVLFYLLFSVAPVQTGATLLNTIFFGVVLCGFYSFYTLTMVTYYATFTEIVDTPHERSLLANVKSVCDIVYFILGYVVVRMLLNGLNIRVVALLVLPLSLTMLIPLFLIKEPSTRVQDSGAVSQPKTVNLIQSLKLTFRNRSFLLWMAVYSFMTFGVQLFLGGINEYFSFVGMSMIFVMMAAFAPVPLTLVLYNRILRKRGFGFAFRYALLTYAVGMLSMFAVGLMPSGMVKTVLSVATGLLSSLSIGALFAVAYSVPAQLAADEEKATGVSHSAMYFAVQGLFSGVATGIGTGIVLVALKGSEESSSGAIRFMTLISAIGVLLAFFLTFTLKKSLLNLGKESGSKPSRLPQKKA